MARHEISNSDNIIDGRDVIARIEELESEREDLSSAVDEAKEEKEALAASAGQTGDDGEDESLFGEACDKLEAAEAALKEWDEDNGAELKGLKDFEDEGSSEWRHGCTLIREDYFEEYAQELAEDIGAINKSASWPATCIDWKEAAEQLQQDYTSADWDGVTYYYQG